MKNSQYSLALLSRNYFKGKYAGIAHRLSVITLMSPENILNRGFAIVKQDNKILRNADTIKTGSEIDIILSGKQITAEVKLKTNYDGRDFNI